MPASKVKIYDEFSEVSLVRSNLWEVDRCFGDATFQWLQGVVDTPGNVFVTQAPVKRLQLGEQMHDQQRLIAVANQMAEPIGEIVGHKLAPMTAKFWLDLPQFGCQMHRDSPEIFLTYQVYIHTIGDPALPCHGVEFFHDGEPYEIPLKPNHGYINLNIDTKEHRVFAGHGIRHSVNFQFMRV